MKPAGAWALVIATVIGLAVGQILFKVGAMRINEAPHPTLASWLNVPIVIALVVYALSTLAWIAALRQLPLSVAYPVVALAFVIVPVTAHFVVDEPLSVRTLVGTVLIVVGVAISVSRA